MVVINIKSKFQRCSVDDFSYQLKKDYILSNIGKFLLKFLYIFFFKEHYRAVGIVEDFFKICKQYLN